MKSMRTVVVGIGNPYFGNDSAGIRVAEMVEMARQSLNADVVYLSTTSFEVVDRIVGYDKAYIIDTLEGEKNGRIHVFRIDDLNSSVPHIYASHALSLTATLRVGYELLPDDMPDVEIIAIEIAYAELGTGCTREVDEAVEKAFRILRQKILATHQVP